MPCISARALAAATRAMLARGPAPREIPPACTVYDDANAIFAGTALVDGAGRWSFPVPIVDDAALIGLELAVQAGFVGTDSPIGIDLTNAAVITLGR